MPSDSIEELMRKVKEQLNEYALGDIDLDKIFEPLLEACSEKAKNESEFLECIKEGADVLKIVSRKVKR